MESHPQPGAPHRGPSAVFVEGETRGIPMARRSPCQHLNLVFWGYICQFASSCSDVMHVPALYCTLLYLLSVVYSSWNVPLTII